MMSENVLIALISAGGVIVAAIIALIGNMIKRNRGSKKTIIRQKAKGNSNIQIGIQNGLNDKRRASDE